MSDNEFERNYRNYNAVSDGKLWVEGDEIVIKKAQSISIVNKVKMITQALNEAGVPCFRCLEKSSTCVETVCDDSFILMNHVWGEHLELNKLKFNVALNIATEIGVNIARMHQVLKKLKNIPNIIHGDFRENYRQSVLILEKQGISIDDKILNECEYHLNEIASLPRQLIHRDVQSRNMLFNENKLVAFLDFDSCEKNIRIYDIVYYSLRTIELNFEYLKNNGSFWHLYFISIVKAYESVIKLTHKEKEMIFPTFLCMQICFIAYFISTSNAQNLIVEQNTILDWIYNNRKYFDL